MTLQVTPLDIAQGYIKKKTLSLEKQLHCDDPSTFCPLCDRSGAAMFHHPKAQCALVIIVYGCRFRLCLAGCVCICQEALHPVSARMHYTECHSQAGGSRQKSVGSLNPVNVEQHLIRSALHRAAVDTLHLAKH